MELIQIVALAVIQGITEFLPISSSAHLILLPVVTGWPDQGLAFDLAVHLGTLLAVLIYFRREVGAMATAWGRSVTGGRGGTEARLAWGVLLATLPAVGLGLLLGADGQKALRLPWVIALTSIVFGVLLGWIDWRASRSRDETSLRSPGFLAIGIAQAVALIPGSSRSGMTILAGRALGLDRQSAARVSFFLAIPVTAAAIAYECVQLVDRAQPAPWGLLVLAAALSCVSAVAAIHWFLRLLEHVGMMPFVVYRVILGVVLLAVFGVQ